MPRQDHRAGPPTPRNEPWRAETPPLPASPGRTAIPSAGQEEGACAPSQGEGQYSSRDEAWRLWINLQNMEGYRHSRQEEACAKAAFEAGWQARKRAQYAAILEAVNRGEKRS